MQATLQLHVVAHTGLPYGAALHSMGLVTGTLRSCFLPYSQAEQPTSHILSLRKGQHPSCTVLCCALSTLLVSLCRLAVFHRLYQQAIALRQKMENRREDIKKTELESILQNKTTMSWISSEMMRDRSAGPFDNYGEMLYAESLESLARKRDKVSMSAHALWESTS